MPSRTAVLRSRILWMRKASLENTSRDTALMGARGSPVFVADRRYGVGASRDEAAISVRAASRRLGGRAPCGKRRSRRGENDVGAVILPVCPGQSGREGGRVG